jgi:beta-lactamase class A
VRTIDRRTALGLGIGAATSAGLAMNASPASAAAPAATADQAARRVAAAYRREARRAGGTGRAYVTVAGASAPAVVADPDAVVEAYSVNKIAVAAAVLDQVDRGRLALDQRVDVTAAIVVPGGDGIFGLDGAYPSTVTLGHVLAALLTVSDDTAVRLCGLVAPAAEINAILAAKGFPHTQVEPVADPNRFLLGTSTARETHGLLAALVAGTLLSAASTAFLLGRLRAPIAFTDGIRRDMSSAERARVATKAGWFEAARHEAAGLRAVQRRRARRRRLRRHPSGRAGPGRDGPGVPRRRRPPGRRPGGPGVAGPSVPAVQRRMMVPCGWY